MTPLDQVIKGADSPTGDDRNADRVDDGTGELGIKTAARSVTVHGGEHDLTGAVAGCAHGPLDRIDARRRSPSVHPDLEPARRGPRAAFGVYCHDEALCTELRGDFLQDFWPLDRRCVYSDLVGSNTKKFPGVFDRANASADGERYEQFFRGPSGHVDGGVSSIRRRGDVEEDDLVGSLTVVAGGEFYRVAGITDVDKVDAFDHPAVVYIEARDDPHRLHRETGFIV